jgi:hypothetical protein
MATGDFPKNDSSPWSPLVSQSHLISRNNQNTALKMLRHVAPVRTDVSEELRASIRNVGSYKSHTA